MIRLRPSKSGAILPVRVMPGARRAGPSGEHNGRWRIGVHEPPEKGKANRAARETVARALGVRPSAVFLARGETSRDKEFLVTEMTAERLAVLLRNDWNLDVEVLP